MILLLLLGPQSVPPLAQDLADGTIVLVGVPLVHQGPVSLTEDHESIHGPPNVILFPLPKKIKRKKEGVEGRATVTSYPKAENEFGQNVSQVSKGWPKTFFFPPPTPLSRILSTKQADEMEKRRRKKEAALTLFGLRPSFSEEESRSFGSALKD